MLFFISTGTRRLEYIARTSNPNTDWITQQARNPLMKLDERQQCPRFLIYDRDIKFGRAVAVVDQKAPALEDAREAEVARLLSDPDAGRVARAAGEAGGFG